jgi:hypothetical protein
MAMPVTGGPAAPACAVWVAGTRGIDRETPDTGRGSACADRRGKSDRAAVRSAVRCIGGRRPAGLWQLSDGHERAALNSGAAWISGMPILVKLAGAV